LYFITGSGALVGDSSPIVSNALRNLPLRIQSRDVAEIAHGNEQLLISRETGAWCILTENEHALYQSMAETPCQSPIQQSTDRGTDRVELIQALHRRGIIKIPGIPDISPVFDPNKIERPFRLTFMLSNQCNLACRYCYLGYERQMGLKTLDRSLAKKAIRFALAQKTSRVMIDFGEINTAWNLIEYLVDFIEQEIKRPNDKSIDLMVQTNGTGLNASRVNFLHNHGFFVGISLDGPEEIHNQNRIDRNGRGTYRQTVDGLKKVLDGSLPHIVLTTISRANYMNAATLLDHFQSLGIQTFAFKPVMPRGRAKEKWNETGIGAGELDQFIDNEFQHAIHQETPDLLDEMAIKFIYRALGDPRGWHNHCPTGLCMCEQEQLFIDAEGKAYPCPRSDSYLNDQYIHLQVDRDEEKSDLKIYDQPTRSLSMTCMECPWKAYCAGGCPLPLHADDLTCRHTQGIYRNIFEKFFPAVRTGKIGPSSKTGTLVIIDKPYAL
jgi:uncharacterized protein